MLLTWYPHRTFLPHLHPAVQACSRTCMSATPTPWLGRACPSQRPAHPHLPETITASRRRGASSMCMGASASGVSHILRQAKSRFGTISCRQSHIAGPTKHVEVSGPSSHVCPPAPGLIGQASHRTDRADSAHTVAKAAAPPDPSRGAF
jgi:hypothetical protein